ncbi:POT family proton-dependent oligopeptide transporter [Dysgonomonas alginatilytica]|uniref:POT family proton-dependent oligopeptide transporter n=1 Tax=Dysgonomonas alginatilytica TaxID=1605892 RepID=A0A2V3PMN2_9BACT|nr:peptide MFS transporter [Dysgonomonas alginatilytica]PXV63207.1 POT family proton-dependent oligopeptide transporter [Dysgonomonas alginatilytica]
MKSSEPENSNSEGKSAELTLDQIQNFEGKYPKQLWYLFTVEMWERFCFYGMRGILTIFMVDQLSLHAKEANLKYGAIQAFVYAFTFLGGIFADKILGFKKSLTFGAIMMIVGNVLIAIAPHDLFYIGITLSVVGTGFFKPNISSMVGYLYKDGDVRKEAGFSMFYSGINVGAFFGGAICVWLGKGYSWSYAFLAAGAVMVLGLITFTLTKKHLGPIGDSPLKDLAPSKRKLKELYVYIIALLTIPLIYIMIQNTQYTDLFMYTIGPAALFYFFYQLFKTTTKEARKKLMAALILILLSIVFFAFFEQAGGSLALFANENLRSSLTFFHIDPNIVNNGANALFVILFSPLLGLLWVWLNKKKIEPNTVVKFGISFLLLGGSFFILYGTRLFADESGQTSLNIFASAYFVMTLAELCLSPIGLSMITSLSPKHLSGMMMGLWFLASAYGQYLAGIIGAGISNPNEHASLMEKLLSYTGGYQQLAIYALIVGVIVLIISPIVRKLMQEVK